MRDEFTTFDIIKTLGIPRERLQDWINRDFIKPTIPAKGQGTKAIFTRNDVCGIALFQSFIEQGLDRNIAGYYYDQLMGYGKLKNYKTIFIAVWKKKGKSGMQFSIRTDVTHRVAPEDMSPEMKKMYRDYKENEKKLEKGCDDEIRYIDHYLGNLLDEYHKEFGSPQYWEPQEVIQKFFKDGKPSVSSGDGSEWDQLHVINFEKIRRKVDMALSGLE